MCDLLPLPRMKSSPRTVWRLCRCPGVSQRSVVPTRCPHTRSDGLRPLGPPPVAPLTSSPRILGCCHIAARLPGRPLPSPLPHLWTSRGHRTCRWSLPEPHLLPVPWRGLELGPLCSSCLRICLSSFASSAMRLTSLCICGGYRLRTGACLARSAEGRTAEKCGVSGSRLQLGLSEDPPIFPGWLTLLTTPAHVHNGKRI